MVLKNESNKDKDFRDQQRTRKNYDYHDYYDHECSSDKTIRSIEIHTDLYPKETSWILINSKKL